MTVPNIPKDPSQGEHNVPFHSSIFIEQSDFREVCTLVSHFKLQFMVYCDEVGEDGINY